MDGGGVNVFLRFEVEVEGALGDVGGGGDVFDAGGGETFFAEDLDGGGEDLLTAEVGEDLLACRDACSGGRAHEIKLARFEETDMQEIWVNPMGYAVL